MGGHDLSAERERSTDEPAPEREKVDGSLEGMSSDAKVVLAVKKIACLENDIRDISQAVRQLQQSVQQSQSQSASEGHVKMVLDTLKEFSQYQETVNGVMFQHMDSLRKTTVKSEAATKKLAQASRKQEQQQEQQQSQNNLAPAQQPGGGTTHTFADFVSLF